MLPECHYDKEKADRAVKFIEVLPHTKGRWAGKPFWLLPWQEQIITKKTEPAASGTWTCACGQTGLTTNFCPNCGARKPESAAPSTWDCACGQKGKMTRLVSLVSII